MQDFEFMSDRCMMLQHQFMSYNNYEPRLHVCISFVPCLDVEMVEDYYLEGMKLT